jgi:ABC-type branched-subunit amino acid transport system substrate-binding protein
VSFPFTSGVPGAFESLPIVLANAGARKQSLVVTDLGAAAAAALLFIDDAAKREGYDLPSDREIKAAPDTSDFAPIVASATNGDPEGIAVFLVGPAAATFLQQLKQSGYKGEIASGSPFLTPPVLKALGDTGNGMLVVSLLSWQKGKNAKLFAKDMNKYAKKAARTDVTANYWLSTWVFEQVAKQIADAGGTVDAAGVLAAMNQQSSLDTGGMTPTLDFTTDSTITKPFALTRLFNPTTTLFEVKGGKLVQKGTDFLNGFEKQ